MLESKIIEKLVVSIKVSIQLTAKIAPKTCTLRLVPSYSPNSPSTQVGASCPVKLVRMTNNSLHLTHQLQKRQERLSWSRRMVQGLE